MNKTAKRPVMLCILDGWGDRSDHHNNAIAQANTPNWDRLVSTNPYATLQASENFVGLPAGQMGNSEVGHMNIGAGRIVMQDLPKIDAAITDNTLRDQDNLKAFIAKAKTGSGRVHLAGLLSPGGVHAHQDHMASLYHILRDEGLSVYVHAITDGRDTPPRSGQDFIAEFLAKTSEDAIATLTGRYFAMDRDQNWDRVEQAFQAIIHANGEKHTSASDALTAAYEAGKSDEFVPASIIDGYDGFKEGDALLMANFRADRAREILHALIDPSFDGFPRTTLPQWSATLGMVEYSSKLSPMIPAVFPSERLSNTLGDVVSQSGLKQLRIAETEKYAHVTFFFNGGLEDIFEGEDRILVPSPKVATYDLQPEMSASEVTDKLVEAIDTDDYDLIVVNYANTDMVGHTGILSAAVKAVEAVDACLGRLEEALLKAGGVMLVTADHGNAEMMQDQSSGQAHTAHTMNPVPLLLVGGNGNERLGHGKLADLAPSLLTLMGIGQPIEMTGQSLISYAKTTAA